MVNKTILVIGLIMVAYSLFLISILSDIGEKETENLRLINSFEEYDKQEYPVKEYNKPKLSCFKGD